MAEPHSSNAFLSEVLLQSLALMIDFL